jgi:hypothetical protein
MATQQSRDALAQKAKLERAAVTSEIADFLFATKSLEKIASGKGSWGDLATFGVSAASFFIAPAKIMQLSGKALTTVIKASSKVVASDTASVAAKRAAAKTLDDALMVKRQGYVPTGTEPTQLVGRAGLPEPTPAYQVVERTVPTERAIAEKGLPDKKYTRTSDEEYDYFERDLDPMQQADDFIASQGGQKKRLTKEELNQRDIDKAQLYDKREFTDQELAEKIDILVKWNKRRTKEDVDEVARSYSEIKKLLEFEKKNPGTLDPKDKAYLDLSFPQLEKEFRTKVGRTKNGERILAKIDDELPENLPPQAGILEEVDPDTGRVIRTIEEVEDTSNIAPTPRGPMTTTGAKIPEDLRVSPNVDRSAFIQAEIRKLENFNKANTNKLKTATGTKRDEIVAQSKENQRLIESYNSQLKELSKKLSEAERAESFRVSKELTKRGMAKSDEAKSIAGEPDIKPAVPGKGGETAKLTTEGKIAKARAEVERLRKEWKATPATDVEARKELAKEAKKFADYIKKLEGN